MTVNYCTLFDKNYLAFGVNLYRSVAHTHADFKFYVLAMDDRTAEVLQTLNLPSLEILTLKDFPEPELRETRPLVSHGQFCWLLQPFLCEKILKKFHEDHIIYMDSDCYFFSSPEPLLKEIQIRNADATLVPHDFSKEWKRLEAVSGTYCVQFNFFRPTPEGFEVLDVWKKDNLKYRKIAPHHYPGQLSLNNWPALNPKVHILSSPLAGVAVWNAEARKDILRQTPPIFYHFHGLHFFDPEGYDFGAFPLDASIIENIYRPYLVELQKLIEELQILFPQDSFLRKRPYPFSLRGLQRGFSKALVIEYFELFKRLRKGRLNLVKDQDRFLKGAPL